MYRKSKYSYVDSGENVYYQRWKSSRCNPVLWLIKNITKAERDFASNFIVQSPYFKLSMIPLLDSINYNAISCNINITMEFVLANLDKNWSWKLLSSNRNLKVTDILANKELPWHWESVSGNVNLRASDILNNRDIPWSWSNISMIANIIVSSIDDCELHKDYLFGPITVEMLELKDVTWNWSAVLLNNDFDEKTLFKYSSKLSDIADIYGHPNIKLMSHGTDLQGKSYTVRSTISADSNLSLEILLHNVDHLVWQLVSENPSITTDIIEQNPNLPWRWDGISLNPNLTVKFIKNNIRKLDLEYLFGNDYIYNIHVGFRKMNEDIEKKRQLIMRKDIGMLPDLAEIVAAYCGYL